MVARDIEQLSEAEKLIDAKIRSRLERINDDGPSDFVPDRNPPEQLGIFTAGLVLAVSLFMLVMWASSRSSYDSCGAIIDATTRAACFERVHAQQASQLPAKGAQAPTGGLHEGED